MTDTDRLAAELHRLKLGCRTDYRGDIDCGGGQYMCHTDPAERLIAAGVTLAPAPLGWGEDVFETECRCGAIDPQPHATDCAATPAPLDALRARISFEAINGVRPVWVAEGVFEQYAARTAECSPVTVEWGEPDADGFYSPVFTEHPEPAPLDVDRLADALTVLPQTAWDPCMAASVDEVAAAIAAAYAEEPT